MTGRRSLDEGYPGSATTIAAVRSRSSEPRPRARPGAGGRTVDGRSARETFEPDPGTPLPSDDHQRIMSDPPISVDAFTDAVVTAKGFDPVLMATEQRQQVRRMVAAAFGEPTRPGRHTRRR